MLSLLEKVQKNRKYIEIEDPFTPTEWLDIETDLDGGFYIVRNTILPSGDVSEKILIEQGTITDAYKILLPSYTEFVGYTRDYIIEILSDDESWAFADQYGRQITVLYEESGDEWLVIADEEIIFRSDTINRIVSYLKTEILNITIDEHQCTIH